MNIDSFNQVFKAAGEKVLGSKKGENNNNKNNELYLHGHKRDLQHCKSILTITITKSKSNNNIKLSIINCFAFNSKQDVTY